MTNFDLDPAELALIQRAAANAGRLPLDHDGDPGSMQYLQTWGVFAITAPTAGQHYRLTAAGETIAAEHGWTVTR